MKMQLNDLTRDVHFDICVIGSGPAGVTVATKLSRAGNKVALLEGGGESYDPLSQDLYKGNIVGDRYYPLVMPNKKCLAVPLSSNVTNKVQCT